MRISRLEHILQELERSKGLSELQDVIESLRDAFAVDHMIYHWVNAKGARLGVGTYSSAWVQRYIDKGYLTIDPVVSGVSKNFIPLIGNS